MKTHEVITQYIEYRKNLGGKFKTNTFILRSFEKYVGFEKELTEICSVQCSNFLYGRAQKDLKITTYWFCIYTALNGLFVWALQRGYVGKNPLPIEKPKKPLAFTPYIFSKEELKAIFNNSLTYRKRLNIVYPESIRIILMITYFLGLRSSETLKLCFSDIHLGDENYVLIRQTKFYKSRMIPFNKQVSFLLKTYLKWRKENNLPEFPETNLFLTRKNEPIKLAAIQEAFRLICKKSNIHRIDGTKSDVRICDFRHTFATNRIVSWYKEGKNVQNLLPVLSTYLGHCNLNSTAVYISFTDPLLHEASNLFESYNCI